jgi:stage II sporulation protein D
MNGYTGSVRNGRERAPAVEARPRVRVRFSRAERRMAPKGRTSAAVMLAACVAALAVLAWPAGASGAKWVIKGRGWGHGVGLSQYGAYGFARHGSGYRRIIDHYYKHTRIGHAGQHRIRVLLASGPDSVRFRMATRACGRRLHRHDGYRFKQSGSHVILRGAHGRRLANCGRSGTAAGRRTIRVGGKGVYRGKLTARSAGGGLQVINAVTLNSYVRGVVPNEMPSSWPLAALEAQALAARSYALATSGGGAFDVYDDTRSQVYGGKDSETRRTNRATRRTAGEVVRHGKHVATTYFFSTSGGRTESVQYGFPGASPVSYLKSVRDPYDGASPYHRWTARFSQRQMQSRLSRLFSGRLRRIKVVKRGVSPRIVRARVVGSHGSSGVSGPELQGLLGLRSTWARFHKR